MSIYTCTLNFPYSQFVVATLLIIYFFKTVPKLQENETVRHKP